MKSKRWAAQQADRLYKDSFKLVFKQVLYIVLLQLGGLL